MKKRIWQWLIGLCLFTAVLGINAAHTQAHLDPPGPPAFQEVVWLLGVNVLDDMDHMGGPGELWLDWTLAQPGHEGDNGRLPAAGWVSLQAPPAAPFPAAFPILLYNHLNCNPLERPLGIHLTLNDDDGLWGADTSDLALAVGAAGGIFGAANAQFAYTVEVMVIPRPELNPLCDSEYVPPSEQPEPPAPPPPMGAPAPYTYSFADNSVTVFGEDGTALLQTAVTGPARVHILPASIIILDDDSVEIYDLSGLLLYNGKFVTKPGFGVFLSQTSLVVFDDAVQVFSSAGQHLGVIPTNGRADVLVGESIIVIDDDSVEIYSWDGGLLQHVNTNGRAQVYLSGLDVIIVDGTAVQIFSQQGLPIHIFTLPPGAAIQVELELGRIIVINGNTVEIYDRQGNLIRVITILNPGDQPPTVLVNGDRIIIIDDDSVEIYDRDGNLIRRIIVLNPGDERPSVLVNGDRIIIIDDDSVEIYDRDGNLIRRIIVLNPGGQRPTVRVDGDRIIIIDDDSVEIYDRDGNLIRRIIVLNPGGQRPTVLLNGDRIIIIDDDSVEIYDRDGNLIRRTHTNGRADVIAYENRTIIADDNAIRMYNDAGLLLLNVPTPGRATITIQGETLLVTTQDGQTTSYSLDQTPMAEFTIFLPVVVTGNQ